MSILIGRKTRVICQGITGGAGAFHTKHCLAYGTKMVAGVTPGKRGTTIEGVPVYDSVREAVREAGPVDASMIFVPPFFAADAIMEAADAGIGLVICITEGIPVLDMVRVKAFLRDRPAVRLLGPNCPGLITPGECKIGIMPGYIHKPGGPVGVISRSGTLTYEAVWQLTSRGIGQSTCVGIGGDPLAGTTYLDLLPLYEKDPQTKLVVLIGEIGGTAEEEAAAWIKQHMKKPVVSFIAGRTAPTGKRMGHAGAIVSGGAGTAEGKMAALRRAGITVADSPAVIGETVARVLGRGKARPGAGSGKKTRKQ